MTEQGAAPSPSYVLAQELAASARYADAIIAYTSAINVDARDIRSRVGRGLAFQRISEHSKAIVDFGEVISSYPNWRGAAFAYYSRAVSRQALGQNIAAVIDCDEAIKRKPDYVDALYLRGVARKALGQVQAAVSDMDAVLRADPSYHEAYFVRGTLHCLQQGWKQAITDFTAAMKHEVVHGRIFYQCIFLRGIAAQELGDHPAAITDFTRVIELVPDQGAAYLRRSRSHRESGNATFAEADFQVGTHMLHRNGQ